MTKATLSLEEINRIAESPYEAVLIMAKRARAITAERKAREELENDGVEDTGEIENYDTFYINDVKAIVVAMEDFFDRRLEVNYRNEEPVEIVE